MSTLKKFGAIVIVLVIIVLIGGFLIGNPATGTGGFVKNTVNNFVESINKEIKGITNIDALIPKWQ